MRAVATASVLLLVGATQGAWSFRTGFVSSSSSRQRTVSPRNPSFVLSSAVAPVENEVNTAAQNPILWEPNEEYVETTAMKQFQKAVGVEGGYEELWQWSVDKGDEFWPALMDFVGIEYSGSTTPVKEGDVMPDVRFFPGVKLNFAENMLKHGKPDSPLKDAEALVSISEARPDKRWTFAELRDDASRVRAALEKVGVTSEDAVGAYLPNLGETIVAMLGTTSTGAVWSSCSPDFGTC